MELFKYNNNRIFDPLKSANNLHITDTAVRLNMIGEKEYVRNNNLQLYNKISWTTLFFSTFFGSSKLSINIYDEFKTWIDEQNGPKIGQNVNINNLLVVQGDSNGKPSFTDNTDGIVAIKDEKQICQNVNSTNKYYLSFSGSLHFRTLLDQSIADEDRVKNSIKEFINTKQILQNEQFILSHQTNCEPG